ncbi:MAG: 3-deoxy-D-manno-octulosonic acid transferase [Thermoanaerobaculia bacterium]
MLAYRALFALTLAGYAPWALARSLLGRRRMGDIRGRLGKSPYPDLAGGVWIHAVSVGEVGVARHLLRALRNRLPDGRFGVSATTEAGRALAESTLASQASVFAFPFDLAGPVERALNGVRPGLILLIETEIWPLFLERAGSRGIPVALTNGRISERSFRRYRLARRWLAPTLSRIALFAMQSQEDARRIEALGAPPERVRVTGNLKYDLEPPAPFPDAERLREAAAGRPVLVAGSTGEGEEALVLDAWSRLPRRPLLVLAPRRPERFDGVAELVESRGLRLSRRSAPDSRTPTPDVFLLDSIGELGSVYREAAVAFIGGSLVPSGGQNPIEAWAAGVPVIAGPHMENFRDVAARGEDLGLLSRVPDAAALAPAIAAALDAPEETARRGQEAARFVAASRGAAETTAGAALALAPALARGPVSAR